MVRKPKVSISYILNFTENHGSDFDDLSEAENSSYNIQFVSSKQKRRLKRKQMKSLKKMDLEIDCENVVNFDLCDDKKSIPVVISQFFPDVNVLTFLSSFMYR